MLCVAEIARFESVKALPESGRAFDFFRKLQTMS